MAPRKGRFCTTSPFPASRSKQPVFLDGVAGLDAGAHILGELDYACAGGQRTSTSCRRCLSTAPLQLGMVRTDLVMKGTRISAIPFTAKREHDTRFHLLQNTTVKNIIDCKTRHVTRFLDRYLLHVTNCLLLTAKRGDSIIECTRS